MAPMTHTEASAHARQRWPHLRTMATEFTSRSGVRTCKLLLTHWTLAGVPLLPHRDAATYYATTFEECFAMAEGEVR